MFLPQSSNRVGTKKAASSWLHPLWLHPVLRNWKLRCKSRGSSADFKSENFLKISSLLRMRRLVPKGLFSFSIGSFVIPLGPLFLSSPDQAQSIAASKSHVNALSLLVLVLKSQIVEFSSLPEPKRDFNCLVNQGCGKSFKNYLALFQKDSWTTYSRKLQCSQNSFAS